MAQERHTTVTGQAAEPIAIVGVGCRLPGNVASAHDLLEALRNGSDCVTEVPADRWNVDAHYDSDPLTPGKTYVRHGGFITDVDKFDAAFFGISDAEASRMDPQQRMALETVWHALEDAGQSAEELMQSNTGVFLAMMNTNGYSQLKGAYEGIQGVTGYDAMGDAMSITAGRISHFLGVEGPCFAVDTACSGSMVALHLARQSILAGECDAAIVLGVSVILHPGIHVAFSKVGLMSRSGRCRAFDESADGYIRGEGCVAVLVRRQSQAIERGDRILASIVGTAINQDGHTPALTAPNGHTQEKVIRMALARVGVSPNEIGYVEAHGTGTPVGDPIEMGALAHVYGPGRPDLEPLYVGSVKSNFGHIESGAGLLGVVKAALSLYHEIIFPSLHFKRLNPNIKIGHAPINVPSTALPWPRNATRRMAGVNSFGYSGTNAHTVLQEAPVSPKAETEPPTRGSELIVLSAKSNASLQEVAGRWVDFLQQDKSTALSDIAFTAATGRTHLRYRLAMVGSSKEGIAEKLRLWREGRLPKGLVTGQGVTKRKPKTAFVFTGQGAQYAGMGRQLYELEPRFKAAIDRCAVFMDRELEVSLSEVLFGARSAELLSNTRYVQPAMFAIEYALVDLLADWGIEPDYLIGHSVGEIVAACIGGILDLKSAARLVTARGRLMGELPRTGKMLAVDAPPEQAQEWIQAMEADVSIAAVNGPRSVVISGEAAAVDEVARLAAAAGRRSRELEVSHAFHSPLMEPILSELDAVSATLRTSPAKLPVISNITGEFLDGSANGSYWSSHVRRPVLFHQGVSRILEAGCSLLIEVGPHPALTPVIMNAFEASKLQCVPTLMRDQQDISHMLGALGSLYAIGVPLRLDRLFWNSSYRRVSLPLYPFRRDRHWIRADVQPESPPIEKVNVHPLLGRAVNIGPHSAVFESMLTAAPPWVDHRVLGSTIFPGAGYLEMAARGFAASKGQDWRSVVMREITFERPLVLAYGKSRKVRLTLDDLPTNRAGEATFVLAAAEESNEAYCRGRISFASEVIEQVSMESLLAQRESELQIGTFYGELRKEGLEYGAHFSTVRELWMGQPDSGEAMGRVTPSPHEDGDSHPFVTTVMLDGSLQVFGAALRTFTGKSYRGTFVPASIQSVTLRRQLPSQVWSYVGVRTNGDGRGAIARVRVLTAEGEVLANIEGLELRQKSGATPITEERPAAASVARASTASIPTQEQVSESREQLIAHLNALPEEKRVGALTKWLAAEVKDIMGQAAEEVDIDQIDPSTAFLEIGLDSLLVTELQRRIQEKLEFRFQPMQGLDYQSIESLAEYILKEVLVTEPAQARTAKAAGANATLADGDKSRVYSAKFAEEERLS